MKMVQVVVIGRKDVSYAGKRHAPGSSLPMKRKDAELFILLGRVQRDLAAEQPQEPAPAVSAADVHAFANDLARADIPRRRGRPRKTLAAQPTEA